MGILGTAPYIVTMDAASLRRMGALMGASLVFPKYYTVAMNSCVHKVVTESKKVAADSFMNPTGTLMRGITGKVHSPWEGIAGVGKQIPYARRREFGFTGMTDKLGRFYPYDPGAMYLHKGLNASRPYIHRTFGTATLLALREIAL